MKKYVKICTVYRSLISICGLLELTLKKNAILNIYKPNVLSGFSIALHQWYSNLAREIHFHAEFSSNHDQTHIPVIF